MNYCALQKRNKEEQIEVKLNFHEMQFTVIYMYIYVCAYPAVCAFHNVR